MGLETTDLDRAQDAVGSGGDEARLSFFRLLANTNLLVLLEREAQGDVLEPRLFDLDEGQVALAFDLEERLALMGDAPLPYAEIPGRVLARLLAGEGLGLGLNLGAGSASEMLLPASAMQWLADILEPQDQAEAESFRDLQPPEPILVEVMRKILAEAPPVWGGLARGVQLFSREGNGLILLQGTEPDAEVALATALSEALRFSDLGGQVVDISFANSKLSGGVRLDWPKAAPKSARGPSAPGMNPDQPPKLR